jgi:CubicO group peptidase (beta-lactamase class C family)
MQHRRLAALWIALSTFILVDSICCAAAYAQGNAIWPTKEWQTSTPEAQGMDSAALAGLIEFGTSRSFDSLLIVRHGRIVLDAYYAPYSADMPHAINSATKAVIGTLTAIAHKNGLLGSLGHRAIDFFGDRGLAEVDDRKNAITIQNLLDMTSGIDWSEPLNGRPDSVIEMRRSPDWIKFILDRPMSDAPGTIFNYNSGNSHLLSAILTKLTGMDAETMRKPSSSLRSGSTPQTGCAILSSSPLVDSDWQCCLATWQRLAICTCATANGKIREFFRLPGSTRCPTPPSI